MIIEDYVSFETAKLLKVKGFEKDIFKTSCLKVFKGNRYGINGEDFIADDDICIPTLQMAMKWLREVYNIAICICAYYSTDPYELNYRNNKPYWRIRIMNHLFSKDYNSFNTYEQACEAAIKYCLENLI